MSLFEMELIKYYLEHVNTTTIDDIDKFNKLKEKVDLLVEQGSISEEYQNKMKELTKSFNEIIIGE